MKAIQCELCGSNEVKKTGDVFVCQNCGTQYEPEAAKKLMVEIDNSKKMDNLRERARKSLEVDDLEHAAEYFKEILDECPNDWEAYFYSYLGESTSFTNAQAGSVALKIGNTVPSAYDMAIESATNEEEIAERFETITNATVIRLVGIASTAKAMVSSYEGGGLGPAGKVNRDLFERMWPMVTNTIVGVISALEVLDDKLVTLSGDKGADTPEPYRSSLLKIRRTKYEVASTSFSPGLGLTQKPIKDEFIEKYVQAIKILDPEFKVPSASTSSSSSSSGGCYVATAVYGSYDCPQVWTLRRYRDYELAETWYGRAFIKTYYAISPTLVKWFGDADWFKGMWRGRLDGLVKKCRAKGFADSPYEDRIW